MFYYLKYTDFRIESGKRSRKIFTWISRHGYLSSWSPLGHRPYDKVFTLPRLNSGLLGAVNSGVIPDFLGIYSPYYRYCSYHHFRPSLMAYFIDPAEFDDVIEISLNEIYLDCLYIRYILGLKSIFPDSFKDSHSKKLCLDIKNVT